MAYITPNSRIVLCSGVPFDKDYSITSYFATASDQSTAILAKAKYTYTPVTYQRAGLGAVRVNHKADDLYDVDYMAFQNTSYGSKWFYAFVDSVDYINDSVSQVNYTIDEVQTWYFDAQIPPCFVERCHSATDDIGQNILPEPVELGEHVSQGVTKDTHYSSLAVVVLYVDVEQGAANGSVLDGVYTGCTAKAFHLSTAGSSGGLDDFISDYIQSPDSIVAMYMCPQNLIAGGSFTDGYVITSSSGSGGIGTNFSLSAIAPTDQLNGYTPKNNKLFTYPYNYLLVTNANGESLSLRYEFFSNLTPKLQINGNISPPVALKLMPCGYKGTVYQSLDPGAYINESIEINNYPYCSWNSDYFKAWLSQNAVPSALNLASGVAVSAMKGDVTKAFGVSQAVNALNNLYSASIHSDIVKGNVSSGNINVSAGLQAFWYSRMSITADYARTIDDFFTRFGYAQNKIMNPPTHNRQKFTYVKTNGCKVNGNLPAESQRIIENAYDNGMTFWNGMSNVGDFSGTNNLLS